MPIALSVRLQAIKSAARAATFLGAAASPTAAQAAAVPIVFTAHWPLILAFFAFLVGGGLLTRGLALRHRRIVERLERLAVRGRRRETRLDVARRDAEAGLAELRAILNTMREGVLTLEEDGTIVSANPAMQRIFGHEAATLVGRNADLLLRSEDTKRYRGLLARRPLSSIVARLPAQSDVRARHADGRTVRVEMSSCDVFENGRRVVIVLLRDLSARNRGEQRLRAAEQRLSDAINELPEGFVLFDAEDRLVVCNERYREIYATSKDLIRVGTKFEDLIREGIARGQYREARGREEAFLEERLRMHRNPTGVVEQLLDDGRWVRVYESRTSEGGAVGFRADITDQKQREAALQQRESQLRAIVSGSFDGIILVDDTGLIVDFNPAAEGIFGRRRADVVGCDAIGLLLEGDDRRRFRAALRLYSRTGNRAVFGHRIEARACRSNGKRVAVDVAVNVSEGAGQRLFVANVRDITRDKARALALEIARDRAESASRAKAGFLAMMSHEIRTPLNGILGLLDLLGTTDLDARQKGYVETAGMSGRALLDIINDILDFSKLEAGKLHIETKAVSLVTILFGVRDLMGPRAAEKGLSLTLDIDPQAGDVVWADAGRLRQVLLNLVGNAIKFTDSGNVCVALRRGSGDEHPPVRWFSVSDTGVGIAAESLPGLFAEFHTLDSSYARRHQGTGLGLAISSELVARMGGRIEVDSRLGEGSTFRFALPLEDADPADLRGEEPSAPTVADHALVRDRSILLVEDNATNRLVITDMLELAGCRVSHAGTGYEAVERIRGAGAHRFDLVLMDISMPELDGVAATRILRRSGNGGVPIVALTAHSFAEERERIMAAGMEGFLTKPVSSATLIKTLAAVLRIAGHTGLSAANEGSDRATARDAGLVIAGLSEERRATVMRQFASDVTSQVARLRQAASTGDLGAAAAACHVLESVLATFGSADAARLSTEIGDMLKTGLHDEALARIPDLIARAEAAMLAADSGAVAPAPSSASVGVTQ